MGRPKKFVKSRIFTWFVRESNFQLFDEIIEHKKVKLNPVYGREEKFRMTNLEWGVYFFRMTNSVRIF